MSFDKDAFMNLIEGDKELAAELLQLYQNDWPEVFDKLEVAVKEANHKDVEHLAHRLKGNMRNFFATEGSQLAADIEEAGREQKLEGVAEKLPQLKTHLQALQAELAEFNKSLK